MTPTPHDALVRAVFGRSTVARELLTSILPAAALEMIDWSALRAVPTRFIHEGLDHSECDLLFEAGEDASFSIYVLVEHQSTVDPSLPLRMAEYVLRIGRRWQQKHRTRASLPLVLPVLLYHGTGRWTGPIDLREMVRLPSGDPLASYIPRFPFHLCDLGELCQQPPPSLGPLARFALEALQHARTTRRNPTWIRRCRTWYEALLDGAQPPPLLRFVMSYAYEASGLRKHEFRALLASQWGTKSGETAMGLTIGQSIRRKLLAEEREEGRAEGRDEGREEARSEGRERLRVAFVGCFAARGWEEVPSLIAWAESASADGLVDGIQRVVSAESREALLATWPVGGE